MGIFLFRNKNYILAATIAFSACILMIVFSDIAVLSAKKGISLWMSNVLPAMLPFFICVDFISKIGVINLLPVNIFPFAMSALSGYPMGAKVVGDMCRNDFIDNQEAKRLMSFCSTSGPGFMIGAVGVGMLASQTSGYVIAVSHYLGAIINGIVFSFFMRSGHRTFQKERRLGDCNLMETLTSSIFAGFKSMGVILAYIIFFMFIMDLISETGFFELIDSAAMNCLIQGFVEMTVGCSSLISSELSLRMSTVMAAVIVSWSGLSIIGQSMNMLAGTGISIKYVLFTKLTHSIFAGIISLFLGMLVL